MEKALEEKQGEYLIGDVAQMVGLSRDALRFYEKKGVIRTRKKENGYRYYSEDDLYKLMYILYHRKMNTSLEVIEGLMSGKNSTAVMQGYVRQRMKEEQEAVRRHRQAMIRLQLVEKDIGKIEQCLGKCSIRRFPGAYIMDNCANLEEGLRQWFRLSSSIAGLDMTYFYNVLAYTDHSLTVEGTQLLLYKGLENALGEEFDGSCYSRTEEIECVYTILQSEETLPDLSMVQRMAQWGHRHGMEPEGKVYSNNMTSFFEKDRTTYCLELYMPVKRVVSALPGSL